MRTQKRRKLNLKRALGRNAEDIIEEASIWFVTIMLIGMIAIPIIVAIKNNPKRAEVKNPTVTAGIVTAMAQTQASSLAIAEADIDSVEAYFNAVKVAEKKERIKAKKAEEKKQEEEAAALEQEQEQEQIQGQEQIQEPTWTGEVLNSVNGTIQGPSGKETYYNLPMDGCIRLMRAKGFEGDYWVRNDGVKYYGNYIMIATDTNRWPKGTIMETSLGTGWVCDHCESAADYPGVWIDIAVTW